MPSLETASVQSSEIPEAEAAETPAAMPETVSAATNEKIERLRAKEKELTERIAREREELVARAIALRQEHAEALEREDRVLREKKERENAESKEAEANASVPIKAPTQPPEKTEKFPPQSYLAKFSNKHKKKLTITALGLSMATGSKLTNADPENSGSRDLAKNKTTLQAPLPPAVPADSPKTFYLSGLPRLSKDATTLSAMASAAVPAEQIEKDIKELPEIESGSTKESSTLGAHEKKHSRKFYGRLPASNGTGEAMPEVNLRGIKIGPGEKLILESPQDLDRVARVVAYNESRGRWNTVSSKGALGRYGIMPFWLPKIGLDPKKREDQEKFLADHSLQEKLHRTIIQTLYDEHGHDLRKTFAAYLGGSKYLGTKKGDEVGDGLSTVNGYTAKAIKLYKKFLTEEKNEKYASGSNTTEARLR